MGAARLAALAWGDPSFVRTLTELLPTREAERNQLIEDLLRFCLSEEFMTLRKKAGLENA